MAIWATAMFDAWAAYDEKAVGSRLGGKLRRPKSEHTLENKKKAISYASYRSLLFVYPEPTRLSRGREMKKLGYDPATHFDRSRQTRGRRAISRRRRSSIIAATTARTSSATKSAATASRTPTTPTTCRSIRPTRSSIPTAGSRSPSRCADGKKVTPGFLTPHWYRVKPFVLGIERAVPSAATAEDDHRQRAAEKGNRPGARLQQLA